MIKTKEDLISRYAVRADEEVFELFMQKCEEFGVRWCSGRKPRERADDECVTFNYHGDGVLTHASKKFYESKGLKRLTLADFKPQPKTRTEYKPVTMRDYEALKAFHAGKEFYYKTYDFTQYIRATLPTALVDAHGRGWLYTKEEVDLDWRDVADDFLSSCKYLTPACDISLCVTKPKSDDPQDLEEWEELQVEFLRMCHEVAELTEKPE